MSRLKHALAALAALVALLFAQTAHATHFRYGNITYYRSDPNNPRTVRFEVTVAWRSTYIDATSLSFGDGVTNANTTGVPIGTGVDSTGAQYTFLRYVVTHSYPANGGNAYMASFGSCCRLSALVNSGDRSFQVAALVDLSPGNSGNPISAMPAITQLQVSGLRTQFIPAVDPDGTPVSCRFATPSEAGDSTITMPPKASPTGNAPTIAVSANPPGCVLTWDTTGANPGSQYSVQVVLESKNPGSNNTSSAAIDYIIELVSTPPPTCTGSGTYTIPMGTTFATTMIGTNNTGAANPQLTFTSVYQNGAIKPFSGTTGASPLTSTFTWSPSLGEAGTVVATAIFTDQKSVSGYCSLTLDVPPCAQFAQPCSAGVGACKNAGILSCTGPSGAVVCSAQAGAPTAEICDGLDNNCDGVVDEGAPGAGVACTSKLPGACAAGTTSCLSGALDCVPGVQPGAQAETCNGVDDDCNGAVDDGFSVGTGCASGLGACAVTGQIACDAGGASSSCDAVAKQPTPELCDGIDNDCDGAIDEDFMLGAACTAGLGICQATGVDVCDGLGGVTCNAKLGKPSAEICGDGIDQNCDGAPDDGCADSDGDGLDDGLEAKLGLDPKDADTDDDGVMDGAEPDYAKDTDGDGLINALDPDSDDDGLFDGTELGKDCAGKGTDASKKHCRPDGDAGKTKTDPLVADTDTGGASDGSEDANLDGKVDAGEHDPSDKSDDVAVADTDGDGLADGKEANPSDDGDGDRLVSVRDVDTDDDGLFDGTERGKGCGSTGTDPSKGHCRADADVGKTKTSMVRSDTDRGGARDGSEDSDLNGELGLGEQDPNDKSDDYQAADSDGDGLSDAVEAFLGTDPKDADSDDDGVLDGKEANPSDDADGDGKNNALDADSDGDGLFDGTELGLGCDDPATNKSKGHCTKDADAGKTKTNPLVADTDEGGVKDGDEDRDHNGAVDFGETDPNVKADDGKKPVTCGADADCGAVDSGQICDAKSGMCGAGCRGGAGNGCPMGDVCTSTDATAGSCEPASTGAGTSSSSGSPEPPAKAAGCACSVVGGGGSGLGAGGLAVMAALWAARRRTRTAKAG